MIAAKYRIFSAVVGNSEAICPGSGLVMGVGIAEVNRAGSREFS
jgi:hypothetical protein